MKKIIFVIFSTISLGVHAQKDTLVCLDYGRASLNPNQIGYYINHELQEYSGGCGIYFNRPVIMVAVIDTVCNPVSNENKDYGQINQYLECRSRAENYFFYSLDSASQVNSFSHLLDSIVPVGNYILVYTWNVFAYSQLNPSFANSLQKLGSVMINTLPDSVPFIFFCQKGNPATVSETHGVADTSFITLTAPLNCSHVGVEEVLAKSNPLITYPNPIASSFTLQFTAPINNAEVIIYDMLGEEMMRKNFSGDKMEIERGNLVSGVYFVKVNAGERQWVEKIMVE